jgi:hypothetical protein
LLGVNGRIILTGGRRMSPIDRVASRERQDVVFDETAPFTLREPAMVIADLTITYRINRRRFSEAWALQVKNVFATADRGTTTTTGSPMWRKCAKGFRCLR